MATIVVKWHSFKCKEIKHQKLSLLYEHKIRSHLATHTGFKTVLFLGMDWMSRLDSRVSCSKPTSWMQSRDSQQRKTILMPHPVQSCAWTAKCPFTNKYFCYQKLNLAKNLIAGCFLLRKCWSSCPLHSTWFNYFGCICK